MSRDLIEHRYGRFYEIPVYLSRTGHSVDVICHDYRNGPAITVTDLPGLTLTSWKLGNPITGFWEHYHRIDDLIRESRPDRIIAVSDCYQIIIGSALAKKYSIPFIADLYDNFEYYRASKIPGVSTLFSRALTRADAITVVSGSLMRFVEQKYRLTGKLFLVENAVSESFMFKRDRQASRSRFMFEDDRIYIGTAGDLSRAKGVEELIKAFVGITKENFKINLVLAGPREKRLNIPSRPNIQYLGLLDHDEIPVLFSALDIGAICIKDNNFGRYCFPQKYYEMIACGLPVIASNVGEMPGLLAEYPALLFRPDDIEDMQRAIRYQLLHKQHLPMQIPTWEMQADKFDRIIQASGTN